jgi:hypothetical protein
MSKATWINQTAISGIWRASSLTSHQAETFKSSHRSVVHRQGARHCRLCMNAPERALVLCVDEKESDSDRIAALLSMGLGKSSAASSTIFKQRELSL